jgi:hypothetical protein
MLLLFSFGGVCFIVSVIVRALRIFKQVVIYHYRGFILCIVPGELDEQPV